MRALAVCLLVMTACGGPTKRDVLKPLQPKLSAVRAALMDVVPLLPNTGSVTATELPDGLNLDDDDSGADGAIIIGVDALRNPADLRQDDPLAVGFAYRHRFLSCLRDTTNDQKTANEAADPAYEADCRRAAEARHALVYRVSENQPARFEQPANAELTYETGSLAVEWFVFVLPSEKNSKAERVGQFTTRVVTPQSLSIEAEPNKPIDMLVARTEAASVMSAALLVEAAKVLATRAKHVDLDPAK